MERYFDNPNVRQVQIHKIDLRQMLSHVVQLQQFHRHPNLLLQLNWLKDKDKLLNQLVMNAEFYRLITKYDLIGLNLFCIALHSV